MTIQLKLFIGKVSAPLDVMAENVHWDLDANSPDAPAVITGKLIAALAVPDGFNTLKTAMESKSLWAEFGGKTYIFTELDVDANFKLELFQP
jgi:hypothetical protein